MPSRALGSILRNTSVSPSMLTRSVRNPAPSQARVIALLAALLDHQARCRRATGGSRSPISRSISLNVVFHSFSGRNLRCSARGAYLDMVFSIQQDGEV